MTDERGAAAGAGGRDGTVDQPAGGCPENTWRWSARSVTSARRGAGWP
jgi:hypothetical protein